MILILRTVLDSRTACPNFLVKVFVVADYKVIGRRWPDFFRE